MPTLFIYKRDIIDNGISYKLNLFMAITRVNRACLVIYNTFRDQVGLDVFTDIYYHNFNFRIFKKLIRESIGNYQSYVNIPLENERLGEVLKLLSVDKRYLLDIKPKLSKFYFSGIFQNFEGDILHSLSSLVELCKKYSKLILVFRNQITDPPVGIVSGFNRICSVNRFDSQVITTSLSKRKLTKGEAYFVIADEDLVYLVENARTEGLHIGTELGIISYDETSLKKIAANCISVISSNFAEMGRYIAEMVITRSKDFRYNRFRIINRFFF